MTLTVELPTSELVVTTSGLVKVEDLVIGQKLLDHKGEEVTVTELVKLPEQLVYELQTIEGRTSRCGASTTWTVYLEEIPCTVTTTELETLLIKTRVNSKNPRVYLEFFNPRFFSPTEVNQDWFLQGTRRAMVPLDFDRVPYTLRCSFVQGFLYNYDVLTSTSVRLTIYASHERRQAETLLQLFWSVGLNSFLRSASTNRIFLSGLRQLHYLMLNNSDVPSSRLLRKQQDHNLIENPLVHSVLCLGYAEPFVSIKTTGSTLMTKDYLVLGDSTPRNTPTNETSPQADSDYQ